MHGTMSLKYVCVCVCVYYMCTWPVSYPCNALVPTIAKFRDKPIFCLPTLSCQLSSQEPVYSINWHTMAQFQNHSTNAPQSTSSSHQKDQQVTPGTFQTTMPVPI